MSDRPTVFENNSADRPTRREPDGVGSGAVTRREGDDANSGAMTRREPDGAAPRRPRTPPPDVVLAEYDYVRDFEVQGAEADVMLLRRKSDGEEVVFKYYRGRYKPDTFAMQFLISADTDHVVHLFDFHDDSDGTWEIQEYCRYGSLRDWVAERGGRLDRPELEAVVREITIALRHMHALGSGIAHRDLKPANVLVRERDPLDLVLADFGLAKEQAFTHLTNEVKGTWHYAAPEVHSRQSSARSDWFSLGVMVYELYTGRKLFSLADGTEVPEAEARARCMERAYTTELVDDPRWRRLVDGLLTWDRDHRWGADEVEAWLRGKSPKVHADSASPAADKRRRPGYRPSWSPTLVTTPAELAAQFRQHWDEAADELAGRADPKMTTFLVGFPGTEDAVRIIKSREAPGSKMVRLQALLNPDGPVEYEGTPLDVASLNQQIEAGNKGNNKALDWLESVLREHILSAYAEVTGSQQAAKADFDLSRWKKQADDLITSSGMPDDYASFARGEFRKNLPQLFAFALSPDDA